jgi:hypothetical protein
MAVAASDNQQKGKRISGGTVQGRFHREDSVSGDFRYDYPPDNALTVGPS